MIRFRKWLINMKRFFPFVLLVSHLKHNFFGVLYWLMLIGVVTDHVGSSFGIPYLLLSPEFYGHVSVLSFLFMGIAFGGFTMAFHSYSYVRIAPKYPFLATVNKPFVRFCINNSIIPLTFSLIYIVQLVQFHSNEEFASGSYIFLYVLFYCIGFLLFVLISLLFIFPMNKNVFDFITVSKEVKNEKWKKWSQGKVVRYSKSKKHTPYWYLGKSFRLVQCRSTRHYTPELLQRVFDQNRISTTLFEITTVLTFIVFGIIGGKYLTAIPAGVSMMLLLTILLMVYSALKAWLRGWTYLVLALFFGVVQVLSVVFEPFRLNSELVGLNYRTRRLEYQPAEGNQLSLIQKQAAIDSLLEIQILENWKKRTGEAKPILFLVSTSGGGLRSVTWVNEVLRELDDCTQNSFFQHTRLITGASGGMIGASFYRSNHLTQKFNKKDAFNAISSDLLNQLTFTAMTNDLFVRWRKEKVGQFTHPFDRGISFENQLNQNTGDLFNLPLYTFRNAEIEAVSPSLIFTPTIVNDGRRLVISTYPHRFLTYTQEKKSGVSCLQENVDIHSILPPNSIYKLRFSSVLRANATFPFVLPMTTLPCTPEIQLMDAGSRDNFGTKTTLRWLQTFENWIKLNTSGVVVVQIRDTRQILMNEGFKKVQFLDKMSLPVTQIFANFPRTQDFDHEELYAFYSKHVDFPFRVISFNLREEASDRISLSFHLTSKEKSKIKAALERTSNKKAFQEIKRILKK